MTYRDEKSGILDKRMKECGFSKEDIKKKIQETYGESAAIFVYTSHLEGLGTASSDFDIYVICDKLPDNPKLLGYDKAKTQILLINNYSLDIEYWEENSILQMINTINVEDNQQIDLNKITMLHRLEVAELINESNIGLQIKQDVSCSKLNRRALETLSLNARSELDDAVQMYYANEYACAIIKAREALQFAIGSLNAVHGVTNIKNKWITKIFYQNNGYDGKYLERYMKLQFFTAAKDETDLCNYAEALIELVQDIVATVCCTSNNI